MTPKDAATAIDRYSTHNQCSRYEAELAVMPAELCKVWYQLRDVQNFIDTDHKHIEFNEMMAGLADAQNKGFWLLSADASRANMQILEAEKAQLVAVFEFCGFTAPEF